MEPWDEILIQHLVKATPTRHIIGYFRDESRLSNQSDILILTAKHSLVLQQTSDCHCCHMGTAMKHPVPDWVQLSFVIFWHLGTLTLRAERQSARMSKITNDGLTRSGTGCFIAVHVWQQWPSIVNGLTKSDTCCHQCTELISHLVSMIWLCSLHIAVMRSIYKDLLLMITEERLLHFPELRRRVCFIVSFSHEF